MKLVVNQSKTKIVSAYEMKIGDIGRIKSSNADNSTIVLRVYGDLISLDNPLHTWDHLEKIIFKIELFQPGDSVTLIQE